MFRCGYCEEDSKAKEWNEVTKIVFMADDIIKIGRKKDSFHICPKCGEQVHSNDIKKVRKNG